MNKISEFYLETQFLVVKFSIYLNRRVFVMYTFKISSLSSNVAQIYILFISSKTLQKIADLQ